MPEGAQLPGARGVQEQQADPGAGGHLLKQVLDAPPPGEQELYKPLGDLQADQAGGGQLLEQEQEHHHVAAGDLII